MNLLSLGASLGCISPVDGVSFRLHLGNNHTIIFIIKPFVRSRHLKSVNGCRRRYHTY